MAEALPRRKNQLFSTGDVNRIIDAFLHPLAKRDLRYWVADTVFHAFVEQNPQMSAEKFLRYTLPKIVEHYTKEQSTRKRRRL